MPPKIAKKERNFATHRFRLQRSSPSESPSVPKNPGARPVCDRCRRLKKRCDRKVPDCANCVHAGRNCSYEALQARVQQLINGLEQKDANANEYTANWSILESPINAPPPVEVPDPTVLVDAFFHHVYRAYPFIDEDRVRRAAFSCVPNCRDTESTILYMIMAIGYTSLERSGKAPAGIQSGFEIPYADIMQRCIMQESIDSIQILVLLALYSLFDPIGPSTWSIVGIITRQALAQGLTRPTVEDNLPPKTVELRRRLFWSVFGLDRMMAVSVGESPGLVVEEMGVPFPAITVVEFASPKRAEHASMLQVSRHVIELRQLESKLLSTVHLQPRIAVSSLTQADRSTITTRLRSEIENWYSHGCLITKPEPDNVRLHDTMGWLNARYYHLLLLLYYPCQFNASTPAHSAARVSTLLELVRKFVQYNRVLLSHQQLPLNRVTLDRLVPACLVMFYCFVRDESSTALTARNEIRAVIDILESFSEKWTHARRLAGIMIEFAEFVASHEVYTAEVQQQEWLRSLRGELVSLAGETLGKATCYQDLIDGEESVTYSRVEEESPRSGLSFVPVEDASAIVCSYL
ncbi:fungal-specific transcription factor domain-containing protein [Aspergillus pseudodeflectus]|uniref:Fungal-specific transcription factor domain-containing protein n=1 Tax=Aspergillus pseudodeflectus TaxID=176178 RepID=A0ABR4KPJ4_9EURO